MNTFAERIYINNVITIRVLPSSCFILIIIVLCPVCYCSLFSIIESIFILFGIWQFYSFRLRLFLSFSEWLALSLSSCVVKAQKVAPNVNAVSQSLGLCKLVTSCPWKKLLASYFVQCIACSHRCHVLLFD